MHIHTLFSFICMWMKLIRSVLLANMVAVFVISMVNLLLHALLAAAAADVLRECSMIGVNPKHVDILMGTFTKSFGAAGGYIAGDKVRAWWWWREKN